MKPPILKQFIYNGSGQFIEDDLKLNIYRVVQEQLNNILNMLPQKYNYFGKAGVSIFVYRLPMMARGLRRTVKRMASAL